MVRACANFYLLEIMSARGDGRAERSLRTLENALAREFTTYLDMAIGGELRYAYNYQLQPPVYLPKSGRGRCWRLWTIARAAQGIDLIREAETTFNGGTWHRTFGGPSWAAICNVLHSYLTGLIPVRVFVDRVWNLEHNSGCVLNKLYSVSDLPHVLAAHGNDDYARLLIHASESTRALWALIEEENASAHDPVWYGTQVIPRYA
jgi:hypothetical protein